MEGYILEANYFLYLMEQWDQQIKMERYIKECVVLAEGGKNTIGKINALNEGVGDKISEYWEKFKAFLAKIWHKFIEKFTNTFNSDKGYCEKYKDIILKSPLKEEHFPIKMKNCPLGITRITNKKLPQFSPNLLDKIHPEDESNKEFKNSLIDGYSGSEDIFVDFAKEFFSGGKDEISAKLTDMNMTDLYNFVVTFDKIKSNLETDNANLKKSVDSIELLLKKEMPSNAKPPTDGTPTGDGKQESFLFKKDKAYSAVYETYITEIEAADANKNNTNSGTTPAQTTTTNKDSTVQGTANNIDKAHDTDTQQKREENLKKETNDTLEKKARIYVAAGNNFLTAKMTAAEFIKGEYMAIIRMHVKDYGGDSKDAKGNVRTGNDTQSDSKVTPINDADKQNIIAIIKRAQAMPEGAGKEQEKRLAVKTLREKTGGKFTGDYDSVKNFVQYKA